MKKYRVAVIGYGWASGAHISAINATTRASVVALCSSRKLDPADIRQRHGCSPELFTDFDAVLRRDDIDVVSICSQPHLHAAQVSAAARAGKHIIVEKPVALSPADAQAAARDVAVAGVKGCVCFEGRFSSQFVATKALIDGGWLGTIHYGECDYYHGVGPWYRQFCWNTRKACGGSSLLSAG
jgi:predicted dehydrogenase